jgi:hypothetical protein
MTGLKRLEGNEAKKVSTDFVPVPSEAQRATLLIVVVVIVLRNLSDFDILVHAAADK